MCWYVKECDFSFLEPIPPILSNSSSSLVSPLLLLYPSSPSFTLRSPFPNSEDRQSQLTKQFSGKEEKKRIRQMGLGESHLITHKTLGRGTRHQWGTGPDKRQSE